MEIQPSDVFDRISIVMQHVIHGNDSASVEFGPLLETMEKLSPVTATFIRLFNTNGCIWNLESDIRLGKEGELGLEEVGKRAIKIREFNKYRMMLKNQIGQELGGFIQTKKDHASA